MRPLPPDVTCTAPLFPYTTLLRSNKGCGVDSTSLPLQLNPSGVIPVIFASSLLLLRATLAGFSGAGGPEWLSWVNSYLGQGEPLFLAFYSALIIFFAYFYTGKIGRASCRERVCQYV